MSIGRSIWQDLQIELRSGNMISRIILINVAFFVVLNLVRLFIWLGVGLDKGLADEAFFNFGYWIFLPADPLLVLQRPWTLITSVFSQFGLGHIFWNMIIFYWFARILREYIGNGKILPIYLMGGIAGNFLFLLVHNLMILASPEMGYVRGLLGASGGVMAIVLATATLLPDYTLRLLFVGDVKLKYLALVMIAIDVLFIADNTGGRIAHIGGAAFGYLFIMRLQAGSDWSQPFNKVLDKVESFFMAIINAFRPKKGPRVVYKQEKKTGASTGRSSKPKSTASNTNQDVVDAILDKINESGYDSLTREEKEILFKAGNRD